MAAAALPDPALPASFAGVLPCSDCDGLRVQLDLWPDGVFHLQRIRLGGAGREDDRGQWRAVPDTDLLRLQGARDRPLTLRWLDRDALVPVDPQGPAAGVEGSPLGRLDVFRPAELQLSLHGMFRYLADAAAFQECLTGRSYPVAMEADFIALERAYRASRVAGSGKPIMASFDGEIAYRPAMEGGAASLTVVVRRFVGVWPEQACEQAMSPASLTNTYWRIARLRGQSVSAVAGQREPHLVLHGAENRYRGHIDCESMSGGYAVDGDHINFEAAWSAEVEPGCTPRTIDGGPPLAALLAGVLADARRWKIDAQVLEYFDARGESIAVFEAVYLR